MTDINLLDELKKLNRADAEKLLEEAFPTENNHEYTGQELLDMDDRPLEIYKSKRWGLVRYRPINGVEKGICRKRATLDKEIDNERMEAAVVCHCAKDKDGKPLFMINALDKLLEKNANEVSTLAKLIMEINPR